MCMCVAQISMISVTRWTARVPDVLSLTVAVDLELCWDQTDKHAWVRLTDTEGRRKEPRGQIICATEEDKKGNVEARKAGNGFWKNNNKPTLDLF